jgi:hypothetical protein
MIPTPLDTNIFTALRSFLLAVLPAGVDVVQAQVNRVPEPVGSDYVLMTPLRRERLETNVDSYADVLFTASIAGTVLTVSSINFGVIVVGSTLFGVGLGTGVTTSVTGQLTGSLGGTGTYSVVPTQTVASQPMAAGLTDYMQPTEVTIQLDVHGPNSADNSQIITTLFRDDYAVQQFLTSGFDVTPLYADSAKQMPFTNESAQFENRWVIEVCMQANIVISAAQQFSSQLNVTLVELP